MFVILHSSCKRNEFNNISFLNLTGELLHVLIDSVILILHYFYYCIVSYCTLILSDTCIYFGFFNIIITDCFLSTFRVCFKHFETRNKSKHVHGHALRSKCVSL